MWEKLLLFLPVAVTVATTVEGLVEPFFKRMTTVLIFNLLGNALVGLNYFIPYWVRAAEQVEGVSGAITCGVAVLCLTVNYLFTSREKKVPMWMILIQTVVFLAANLLTFSHTYDILALIAAMLFVLSIAQDTTKYYRLLYISNSLVWIGYDIFAKAWPNLVTHSILCIAIFISILVRDGKKTKKEEEQAL